MRLDEARRRLLRLAAAAGRYRREGDAPARRLRAGRLRAGNRILRRRIGCRVRPPELFAPRTWPDHRGRPAAGRRDRARADAAGGVRFRAAPRRRWLTWTTW